MAATGHQQIPEKRDDIVVRKSGDGYIVVPVVSNIADMTEVYTINETGAFIWDHIDGKRDRNEIAGLLASHYEIDTKSALNDTEAFLDEIDHLLRTAP